MKLLKIFSKSLLWRKLRYCSIVSKHRKVVRFWQPIIQRYVAGEIAPYALKPKVEVGNRCIIWQYWGQGFDDASVPDVVRLCAQSVDKYKGDCEVIRLTDDTIADYVDFPDFVIQKLNDGTFGRTHFSDLLRVSLLSLYGGVWIDATILLTGELPRKYRNADFFMFQRDEKEPHKPFWMNSYAYYWGWSRGFRVRMLSSIIFGKAQSTALIAMRDLLLYYWQHEQTLIDYFFFQIMFDELVQQRVIKNCEVVSDTIPHIFQTKVTGDYPWMNVSDLLQLTSIHKLSYFDEAGMKKLKAIIS